MSKNDEQNNKCSFPQTSGSVPPSTNSRLSPLPPEPADFFNPTAPVDIPLDSAADLKKKERDLLAKEAELKRREQASYSHNEMPPQYEAHICVVIREEINKIHPFQQPPQDGTPPHAPQ